MERSPGSIDDRWGMVVRLRDRKRTSLLAGQAQSHAIAEEFEPRQVSAMNMWGRGDSNCRKAVGGASPPCRHMDQRPRRQEDKDLSHVWPEEGLGETVQLE